jgi:hypothetical protein
MSTMVRVMSDSDGASTPIVRRSLVVKRRKRGAQWDQYFVVGVAKAAASFRRQRADDLKRRLIDSNLLSNDLVSYPEILKHRLAEDRDASASIVVFRREHFSSGEGVLPNVEIVRRGAKDRRIRVGIPELHLQRSTHFGLDRRDPLAVACERIRVVDREACTIGRRCNTARLYLARVDRE